MIHQVPSRKQESIPERPHKMAKYATTTKNSEEWPQIAKSVIETPNLYVNRN